MYYSLMIFVLSLAVVVSLTATWFMHHRMQKLELIIIREVMEEKLSEYEKRMTKYHMIGCIMGVAVGLSALFIILGKCWYLFTPAMAGMLTVSLAFISVGSVISLIIFLEG